MTLNLPKNEILMRLENVERAIVRLEQRLDRARHPVDDMALHNMRVIRGLLENLRDK